MPSRTTGASSTPIGPVTFLDALRPGSGCGSRLPQFPPDFTRRVNRRDLAAYLDWLAPEAPDLSLAVECAADLMTASFARFLAGRNFALVLVDRIGTADLYDTWLECVDAGARPRLCAHPLDRR